MSAGGGAPALSLATPPSRLTEAPWVEPMGPLASARARGGTRMTSRYDRTRSARHLSGMARAAAIMGAAAFVVAVLSKAWPL